MRFMAIPQNLRKGVILSIDGHPHVVLDYWEARTAQRRATLHVKLRDVKKGKVVERTLDQNAERRVLLCACSSPRRSAETQQLKRKAPTKGKSPTPTRNRRDPRPAFRGELLLPLAKGQTRRALGALREIRAVAAQRDNLQRQHQPRLDLWRGSC